mmetsp:Transcript_62812/g.172512  ORF Transcript_62812/g.172512 Transcript_62812/m.172512 type:complete len:114 (+) Transcript_62812:3-344(+)
MVQQGTTDDYVIATGRSTSVRDFIVAAFEAIGLKLRWVGAGVSEQGVDAANATRVLVRVDPNYFRPTEVEQLLGDGTKARTKLGWAPRTTIAELCREMVEADLKLIEAGDLES